MVGFLFPMINLKRLRSWDRIEPGNNKNALLVASVTPTTTPISKKEPKRVVSNNNSNETGNIGPRIQRLRPMIGFNYIVITFAAGNDGKKEKNKFNPQSSTPYYLFQASYAYVRRIEIMICLFANRQIIKKEDFRQKWDSNYDLSFCKQTNTIKKGVFRQKWDSNPRTHCALA